MESVLNIETSKPSVFIPFDLLHTDLKGHNLIEASAGTGKTFTITRIFIRLLLEKELPISSILVVTFTEAATFELRERIYLLLKEVLNAFITGSSNDPFLQYLLGILPKNTAQTILKRAISNFDSCAIYTIHGFCQRIISDNAFESESTFGATIITDQNDLIKESVNDFWRIHFYNASPMFISYVAQSKITPETFLDLFLKAKNFNQIQTIPTETTVDFQNLERSLTNLFEQLKSEWEQYKDSITHLLNLKTLKGNKYSEKIISKMIISMDDFCNGCNFNPLLFKSFSNFTTTTIIQNTKKGEDVIKHCFFDSCEEILKTNTILTQQYATHLINLQIESLDYINEQITAKKETQNVLYFDDLLHKVHNALMNKEFGWKLAKILANKYRAALIDEFQDTDPLQYSIFKRIFSDDTTTSFFIGDPKQAIYSFRGADIFTYLKAAQQVTNKYTLNTNYRTHPELISAVSFLFSLSDNPFLNKEIAFTEPECGISDQQSIVVNGVKQKPLKILFADEERKLPESKQVSIPDAIADEIIRLIAPENKNKIRMQPIVASNIAILVRTNSEALTYQQILSKCGISSVIDSNSSVFTTIEAQEIYYLLCAVAEPTDNRLINAALTLPFFGLNSKEIELNLKDDQCYNNYLDLFSNHHFMWLHEGFDIMISSLFNKIGIYDKILSLPSGERKLTNYLHIKELINREYIKGHQRLSSLLSWLSEKIEKGSSNISDDEIIRLESDEDSVQIITIHKSKGLEYDVVFCPSIGITPSEQKPTSPYIFHNQDNNPVLVIGKEEKTELKNYLECETLAENLRLFYVALTRAKISCYLIFNNSESAMTSAFSYLLFGKNLPFPQVALLKEKLNSFQNNEIFEAVKEITRNNPYISSELLSDRNTENFFLNNNEFSHLSCRTLINQIPETWKIASYSSLTHSHNSTGTKYDEFISEGQYLPSQELQSEQFTIFNFPKGAKAGTLLHDLLENIDLSNIDENNIRTIISEKLIASGFDPNWDVVLLELIKTISQIKLNSDTDEFSLSEITLQNCIKEMVFYFPLKPLTPTDLLMSFPSQMNLFRSEYSGEKLQFSPMHGFLKGFIDMIFIHNGKYYILDWKSNFLGTEYQDYHRDSLIETMKKENYFLQSYLYCVALHQYLHLHLPKYSYKDNFGGVFYLFLRGLSPHMKTGIFFDKPQISTIEKLSTTLITDK